jgi:hypothetical protein
MFLGQGKRLDSQEVQMSNSKEHSSGTGVDLIESRSFIGTAAQASKERAQSHEGSRKVRVRQSNLELNITD